MSTVAASATYAMTIAVIAAGTAAEPVLKALRDASLLPL
jgi:hypothetical protein